MPTHQLAMHDQKRKTRQIVVRVQNCRLSRASSFRAHCQREINAAEEPVGVATVPASESDVTLALSMRSP
jgi:hypothetical protein